MTKVSTGPIPSHKYMFRKAVFEPLNVLIEMENNSYLVTKRYV
jgi:hypothetical protein